MEHVKTARYRGKLAEPTYEWFAKRREEDISALNTHQVLGISNDDDQHSDRINEESQQDALNLDSSL